MPTETVQDSPPGNAPAETSAQEDSPENQERKTSSPIERAKVKFTDLDFLVMLIIAGSVDLMDIIFEIFSFLLFPKLLGLIVDSITLPLITVWIYARTNRLEKAKARTLKGLSPDSKKRYQRAVLGKVLKKMGCTMLGEMVPFVGIVPFWTLRVLSTLKEK